MPGNSLNPAPTIIPACLPVCSGKPPAGCFTQPIPARAGMSATDAYKLENKKNLTRFTISSNSSFFNTHTEKLMNFPKRCLPKLAVRLIRAPVLPPGVLAVAAAFPHFNHVDAGAGDPAVACAVPVKSRLLFLRLAPNIPRLPRCPKYRVTSLNDLNSARARLKPRPGGDSNSGPPRICLPGRPSAR